MREETWAEADTYEPYVGRWSRSVAQRFLGWLDMPPQLGWVDVGCGTGALTHAVLALCSPARLLALDRSSGFLVAARHHVLGSVARFAAADAANLPLEAARFDVAVSGLVLNFVPDPDRMILEMTRVLGPSGSLALYVWDYGERMELMRYFWDAAVDLDPSVAQLDEGRRFPICRPDALRSLFEGCGLVEVDVRAIDVPTVFRDFADYWSPFLGGQGPAPGYALSLSEEHRSNLRELLESRLPRAADGTIALVARAWAVRGRMADTVSV